MAQNKKSVSLSPEAVKIVENFVSRCHGVDEFSTRLTEIVEDYVAEVARAKQEIEGIFSEPELNFVRDMMNSTIITAQFHPVSTLVMMVEDSQTYDNLGDKWKLSTAELVTKIKRLTSMQGYAVLKLSDEWWAKQ